MPKVTIYHYPNWGSSKNALAVAEELGIAHEVVLYIKTPPQRKELEAIISGLEDPVEDLVRKDSKFKIVFVQWFSEKTLMNSYCAFKSTAI